MAEITASMVKELREKTDAPMMECKKALTEAAGDMGKAEEILRVKLGNKASKAATRVAAEGVVGINISTDGKLGSIMGSGGMIVMDDTSNMVDVARFFMEFCMDESCGKCIPCRAGTVQMHNLLDKILKKKATKRDLEKLEELCDMVKNTSLCGLGQTAPNPTLSTLRFFRGEYEQLLQPDKFGPRGNGESKKAAAH